jgi:uncharacterized protein
VKRSWLASVAALGVRAPKRVLALAFVLLAVFGVVGAGTPINTARHTMVAADNPHQAKQIRFFDRFGLPNGMILVVGGGDEAGRRAAVRALGDNLEADDAFRGRVLGRIGPEQVAELLFLHQPRALVALRAAAGGDLERLVKGGLLGLARGAADGLDPARLLAPPPGAMPPGAMPPDAMPPGAMPPVDPAMVAALQEQLGGVSLAFEMLALGLSDDDLWQALGPELARRAEGAMPRDAGVDADGYLVSSDGDLGFVAIFPALKGAQGFEVRPTVESIRAIAARSLSEVASPGVTVRLTGAPALAVDEEGEIQRGLQATSAFTGLAIMVLLFSAFRSIRYTLLALVPTAVGVAATMAVARAIYGELNMVTSSSASVLLALGIDFGVFLLSRYGEQVRAGDGAAEAIEGAVRRAGVGLFVGAITTATAFLTTTTTEFTAYARLGVIVSLGLLIMMAFTLVLMPALLWVAGRGDKIASPELVGVRRLPPLIRRGRWPLLAVGVLLVLASLGQARQLTFNTRFYDFIPDEGESASALLAIERDPVMTPLFATAAGEGVEPTRALAERLRKLDGVAAVHSATDLLPRLSDARLARLREGVGSDAPAFGELPAISGAELRAVLDEIADHVAELERLGLAGPGTARLLEAKSALVARLDEPTADERLERMQRRVASVLSRAYATASAVAKRGKYAIEDLPAPFRVRYASLDGQALALDIVPKGDIWDPPTAAGFAAQVATVAPEATGMAMHVDAHLRMIREGFTRAAVMAAVLVLMILLIAFRRFGHAVLALVPTLVGFAWMLGAMRLIGLDFDAANIVTLPLIMGIGVDAGVHLVHRMRQSAEEHGTARLDEVVGGTGAAVALASLTTIAGFASLMLADYGAMQSLGLAMTLGITSTLLASLIVLPSLMVVLGAAE